MYYCIFPLNFTRPGVAGVVLQTVSLITNWVGDALPSKSVKHSCAKAVRDEKHLDRVLPPLEHYENRWGRPFGKELSERSSYKKKARKTPGFHDWDSITQGRHLVTFSQKTCIGKKFKNCTICWRLDIRETRDHIVELYFFIFYLAVKGQTQNPL